jgi:hypothetical protein
MMDTKVGYREGLPVVSPPSDVDIDRQIGDSVDGLYSHYIRGDELLKPSAGTFLTRLFDSDEISSVSDAAKELNSDKSVLRKAVSLHGSSVEESDSTDDEPDSDEITLPSGESVPETWGWDNPLIIGDCLSSGMSFEEISLYLSEEVSDEQITPSDIRKVVESIFSETDSTHGVIPQSAKTTTVSPDGDYSKSPW